MSLLTIVQDAMVIVGLEAPASAYANTDTTVQQFIIHARLDGESLARDFAWRQLMVEATLTGDGTSTIFDLPTDFDRWADGQVFFKSADSTETYRRVTSEQMTYLKASTVEPVWPVWRMIGSTIEFFPAIPSADVLNADYITSHWILDVDGTTRKSRWASDTDTSLIPERLITLGTVWRWKKSKGLAFTDDMVIQQSEIMKMTGQESGSETLNLGESTEWYDVYPSFKVSAGA